MLLAELRELFGSRLLTKNRDGRIARHKLDEKRYERDDGPNNEQENEYATQSAQDSIPMLRLQDAGDSTRNLNTDYTP